MRRFFCLVFLVGVLASCSTRSHYVQIQGFAQGGVYTVKINLAGTDRSPQEIQAAVDSILTLVDTTLSGYNKASMLSRFNAGIPIRPNPLFLSMYEEAYAWWERSEGAVDCAAGPLFDAWGFGFKHDSLPSPETVAQLRSRCGMHLLKKEIRSCISGDGTLRACDLRTEPDTARTVLNYNAIAQGVTADLVADYLYRIGVRDMLVDIGEIWSEGLNPSGKPWTFGIDRPFDGNVSPGADLSGIFTGTGRPCGVVTSGNYRKYYVKDGKKYAHTIDPRTGFPAENDLLSATIVVFSDPGVPTSGTADALATWCMVLGREEAAARILADPSVEACLIYSEADGTMREWFSPGFPLLTSRQ